MNDRIKYGLVYVIVSIIKVLPLKFARKFADGLAWLLNNVFNIRREVVENNLRGAFPDFTDDEITTCRNRCYNFFSRATVDWLKMDKTLRKETVKEEGWKYLKRQKGTGAIVVSGHFGYWELAATKVAQEFKKFTVYADRQTNPHADNLIKDHRRECGLRPVTGLSGVKKLLRELKNGNFIGAMGDQRVGDNFHYVRFFDRAVRTPRIIPYLARQSGCPVIPMSACRKDDHIKFRLHSPLESSGDSMTEGGEHDLLRDFHAWLENCIRKHPEQYFWFHRRWKDSKPVSELQTHPTSNLTEKKARATAGR
jgi:KDO2-lipid IV(A) lauroyltransferase